MKRRQTHPEEKGRFTRVSPRHRRTRRETERRRQVWAIVVGIIVVIAVISIPIYGYYSSFVAPPRHTVASVNATSISLGELTEHTSLALASSQKAEVEFSMASGPFQVLNNMVQIELIKQNASKLSISVDSSDVDKMIHDQFYPLPPEGQEVTTSQLDNEYEEQLRRFLNLAQLSMDKYRGIVRDQLFYSAARQRLEAEIPRVAEQVYAHWIKVDTEQQAGQVQYLLDQGDEFVEIAQGYNLEKRYADDNGEVGWVPRDAFQELDQVLFTLEHGELGEPIYSADGIYFVKVSAGPESRDVSEAMVSLLSLNSLQNWVNGQYSSNTVKVDFGSKHYEWLVNTVQDAQPLVSRSQP